MYTVAFQTLLKVILAEKYRKLAVIENLSCQVSCIESDMGIKFLMVAFSLWVEIEAGKYYGE